MAEMSRLSALHSALWRSCAALVCLALVCATPALAQAPRQPDAGASAGGPREKRELDGARERWKQLTPEQREELKRRHEELKRLAPEERERLRGRLERLHDAQRRALDELPESARRELERLEPPARRDVLREVAVERLFEHQRDVLQLMPPPLKDAYERAGPAERERMVREFGRTLHERSHRELHRLGRELDVAPERVEQIAKLPPHEMMREVLALKRQSIERTVDKRGLPAHITQAQWSELSALSAPEFVRRWGALHGHFGPPERRGGPGADAQHPGAGEGPLGPPPGGRRDGFGPRDGEAKRGGEKVRALREALRPDPSWFVEFSRLDPHERRHAIGERIRERAVEFLSAHPEVLEPEKLEKLRAKLGPQFHDELHRLFPDLGEPPILRGRGGERRGPPPFERGPGGARREGGGPGARPGAPAGGSAPAGGARSPR
jgi:hypothetical protein